MSHILLSYPLGPRTLLTAFRGGHYASTLESLLRDPRSNVLVVYGDRDEFTGVENYDAWANSLRAISDRHGGKECLEIAKVDGGNHFWGNPSAREALVAAVRKFLS